jgi:hypothetical protein
MTSVIAAETAPPRTNLRELTRSVQGIEERESEDSEEESFSSSDDDDARGGGGGVFVDERSVRHRGVVRRGEQRTDTGPHTIPFAW